MIPTSGAVNNPPANRPDANPTFPKYLISRPAVCSSLSMIPRSLDRLQGRTNRLALDLGFPNPNDFTILTPLVGKTTMKSRVYGQKYAIHW